MPHGRDKFRMYIKGAPDMLFPLCTKIVGPDGKERDINQRSYPVDKSLLTDKEISQNITSTGRDVLDRTVLRFARQSFRTILMCYKDYSR